MFQQLSIQPQNLSFGPQALQETLLNSSSDDMSGYWTIKFDRLARKKHVWHLGLLRGQKIHYAGTSPYSCASLLKIIRRYVSSSRREPTRSILADIQNLSQQKALPPADLLEQLVQMKILSPEQLTEAIRLKVLTDLDIYLSIGAGTASFVPEPYTPSAGGPVDLPLAQVLQQALQRRREWHQVKKFVPSMRMIPIVDSAALERSSLPEAHRQWLRKVVQPGKTIADISALLAKDTLETANQFAAFKRAGVVRLESQAKAEPDTVMIIDDSPIVLMQFQYLVTALGYPVVVNQDAEKAIEMIRKVNPAIIFIDINMPGISGFELVKKIRLVPAIASIPLVILTGELKLSNKWRAQWSGCDFLTKPLSISEINQFQGDLQAKLQAVMPKS